MMGKTLITTKQARGWVGGYHRWEPGGFGWRESKSLKSLDNLEGPFGANLTGKILI